MSNGFTIWRDPKKILTRRMNQLEREEAWEQWKSQSNREKVIVASNNGELATDLDYVICGYEHSSPYIDKKRLQEIYIRLSSKEWLKAAEINEENLPQILMIYRSIEETIGHDGYVVYENEEQYILDYFVSK